MVIAWKQKAIHVSCAWQRSIVMIAKFDINLKSFWPIFVIFNKVTSISTACCSWMPSDYVDPCTPPSLSISLAHAYRDNELVSVPVNLLVQGDVVVLGPGHTAPAQVQQVGLFRSRYWSIRFYVFFPSSDAQLGCFVWQNIGMYANF